MSSDDKGKDVFISPLSISLALAMTMNGANSDTLTAMKYTLELDGPTDAEINEYFRNVIKTLTALDPRVTLKIADSICPSVL